MTDSPRTPAERLYMHKERDYETVQLESDCAELSKTLVFSNKKKNNREAHSQHREISIANYCTEEKYIYNFETLM